MNRPSLSPRFNDAFEYAADLHAGQFKKGKSVPYIAHLMGVAAYVMEEGGDEDQAIGALLHDAIEDHPRDGRTRSEIEDRFGKRVLEIVEGCSDTDQDPKPPWRQRKEEYLAKLPDEPADVRLVSLADKLYNARSILADHARVGPSVWDRFNASREETLWYYRELVNLFSRTNPGHLSNELRRTVSALAELS